MPVPKPEPANNKSTPDLPLAGAIRGLAGAVANMNNAIRLLELSLSPQAAVIVSDSDSSPAHSLENSPVLVSRPVPGPAAITLPFSRMERNPNPVMNPGSPALISLAELEATYVPFHMPPPPPPSVSAPPVNGPTLIYSDPIQYVADTITGHGDAHWYAVTVGREPGIFCGSETIMANTFRIKNGRAIKRDTEDEAKAAFDAALDAGLVERVEFRDVTRTVITRDMVPVGTYIVPK